MRAVGRKPPSLPVLETSARWPPNRPLRALAERPPPHGPRVARRATQGWGCRDQVDRRAAAREAIHEVARVFGGVVRAAQKHVFVGHFAAGLLEPSVSGRQDLLDRNSRHGWHQLIALFLKGRVQRNGQIEAWAAGRGFANPLGKTDGGNGHLASTQLEPFAHGCQSLLQRLEVEQWLADPHDHGPADGTESACAHELFDDFVGFEIAQQPLQTRRAKWAAHGATRLRRNAHGGSFSAALFEGWHVNRFDRVGAQAIPIKPGQ